MSEAVNDELPDGVSVALVSDNYWAVVEGETQIGCVVGGGPTEDTKYKAVGPSNVAMNPDVAPGGYARTLSEAVEILRGQP